MWKFQARNAKPIHCSKCAHESFDPSGYPKDRHVTELIEETSYDMSEQDYDCLNEIINHLGSCNDRDCSYVVQKEIWKIGNDLTHYRDLTQKKTARPPKNKEELWMIKEKHVGCEKNRHSI